VNYFHNEPPLDTATFSRHKFNPRDEVEHIDRKARDLAVSGSLDPSDRRGISPKSPL